MQTIAGIHYNFSLSDKFWTLYQRQLDSPLSLQDFKTDQYFNLIRNFRRYSWLLIYLFGASPAVCKSFLHNNGNHGLESFDDKTLYAPYGTSLRMGDLGYTSQAQAALYISYNNLQEYAEGLTRAINTPYSPYEKFSRPDGRPVQVNTGILQIENEFYSTIRPKRVVPSGKRPVKVLSEQGVEYIEVRCLDLNPFLPIGIDEEQIHFLDSFLIFCLLRSSPPSDREEYNEIENNLRLVVQSGRKPGLLLHQGGAEISLRDWAGEILGEVDSIAEVLDSISGNGCHRHSARVQQDKIDDPESTPSAKVLQRMRELETTFFRFAMNQSLANSDYFRHRKLEEPVMDQFRQASEQSVQDALELEKNDTEDFETYLELLNESQKMDGAPA